MFTSRHRIRYPICDMEISNTWYNMQYISIRIIYYNYLYLTELLVYNLHVLFLFVLFISFIWRGKKPSVTLARPNPVTTACRICMFSSQPLVRNEDGKHPRLPGMKQTLLFQHMMRLWNSLHFQEVRHFHHIHGKKPSITISIVFYWCFQLLRAWARTHGTPHLWAFQGCAKCFFCLLDWV